MSGASILHDPSDLDAPTTADRLRKLVAISAEDPSVVGAVITAFAPLLIEAADELDTTA